MVAGSFFSGGTDEGMRMANVGSSQDQNKYRKIAQENSPYSNEGYNKWRS